MISNGWMLEELSNAKIMRVKIERCLVSMIELHDKQRMTTDAKDAVTGRHSSAMQHFTPQRIDVSFDFVSRLCIRIVVVSRCRLDGEVRWRKSFSIQFSVGIQWELLQHDERGRNHE